MTGTQALLLVFALGAAGNALHAHAGLRRPLSLLVVMSALVVPFACDDPDDLLVTLTALFSQLGLFRWLDFDADRTPRSAAFRAFAAGFAFDLREMERRPRSVNLPLLARAVVHGTLFVSGIHLGLRLAPTVTGCEAAVRWTGGIVATYGMLDAISSLVRFVGELAGFWFPPMQRDPILARSLGEFWGERWNRTVNRWLRRRCFVPWARRRRPRLGLALGFVASAWLHAFMVLPRGGTLAATLIASYFLLEGCLLGLERSLRLARLPRPLQHLWTVVAVVGPAPLLVDPILVAMGHVPTGVLPTIW